MRVERQLALACCAFVAPAIVGAFCSSHYSESRLDFTRDICLYEKVNENQMPGTARFTGIESTGDGTPTNLVDSTLALISSDVASILLGTIGLLIAVIHRLSNLDAGGTEEALADQTRADLLAVFACGSVVLNGITKLDVTSALSEAVELQGVQLPEPDMAASLATTTATTRWAMEALLKATPAKSIVLLERESGPQWKIAGRAGILPSIDVPAVPESTPILNRVGSQTEKETYLPTLQALPGKVEFTYLPSNTQLALLIPLFSTNDKASVMVIGSNAAKSFSPRDVAWARMVAERVASAATR